MVDVGMGDEEVAQLVPRQTGPAERGVDVTTRVYEHTGRICIANDR